MYQSHDSPKFDKFFTLRPPFEKKWTLPPNFMQSIGYKQGNHCIVESIQTVFAIMN